MSVILRSKKLRDGRKSLFLDVYSKGQRKFIFLGLYLGRDASENRSVMEIANKTRLKMELEQASGRLGVTLSRKDILLSEFLEGLLKGKEQANTKSFKKALHHIELFGGKGLTVKNLNPIWVEDFKNYLLQKVQASTASLYLSKLKTLMKAAVKQELIPRDPCEGISIRVPETAPKYLTLAEVRLLMKTPISNTQVRDAFLFGIMSGLRWSDITALKWTDIIDNTVLIKQQKTQRMVSIPLSKYAIELLEFQKNTPTPSGQDDTQVFKLPCTSVVQRTLKSWAKKSGINKSISPHWSRHSFATLLINAGADPYVISSLMGHTKVGMTLRYANLLNPRKQEVIATFPKLMA